MENEEMISIVPYITEFEKKYFSSYDCFTLSELFEIWGLEHNNSSADKIEKLAEAMQKDMILTLFADEEFNKAKILGHFFDKYGNEAFILYKSQFMENKPKKAVKIYDYICYSIFISDKNAYFGFSFLYDEDIQPSPLDGFPVSVIEELLPF